MAAGQKRTGWVCQIIWVDERVVHWVRRVDVDLTVTEGVLKSGVNPNGAINVVLKEELHQANGTGKDSVCRRVVDGVVAGYDARVRARIWNEVIDFA